MNKYQELLKEYTGKTKTYKEWCDILGEDTKRGKSKGLHLKQWEQYIDIEPNNRKLTLVSIYDDNNLQLIEKHGKFTTYIENFLMEYLKDCTGDYVILSNRDILDKAYMVNKNYFKGKKDPYIFAKDFDIHIKEDDIPDDDYMLRKIVDDNRIFFSASYRLLKRIIYDSLTSIERKSLIQKNKTFKLYRNVVNENGDETHIAHNCTDAEIDRILTTQHKSIKEFNDNAPTYDNGKKKYYLNDIKGVHILHKDERDIFYDILTDNIKNEFIKEGYNAYSTAWKINLANKECFEYELKRLNYAKLNNNIQDKLLNAKDLMLIEDVIKQQLVDKYIKL